MSAIGTHTVTVTDTLLPLNAVLKQANGDPYDLANYTVKAVMELTDGTSELAAATTGVTAHPTQTFTAASTGLATCNGHGVQEGDQIVVANSGGALPSGLAASTRYFAVQVNPNTFGLATTPGGPSVIAGAGTGTHTFYIVGSVQFDFAAGNVDTAQIQRFWFQLSSGSETKHLPEGDRWIEVKVVNLGS